MRKILLGTVLMLTTSSAFAESALRCPSGIWDLGARVAALSVNCLEEDAASLSFCNREAVRDGGDCNSIGTAVQCRAGEKSWNCVDESNGYHAEIFWTGDEAISFKFKSSFNEGEFSGKRF